MSTLLTEIDAAAWHRMFHAYGIATNTPGHLASLTGDDPAAHKAALEHLFSAEIHQGAPWPSTATTAVFVARLLAEGHIADAGVRVSLLDFLHAVAEAGDLGADTEQARARAYPADDSAINHWLERYLAADETGGEQLFTDEMETGELLVARAAVDCHDAMPTLLGHVLALTGAPEPQVRAAAFSTAAVLVRHPRAGDGREHLCAAMAEAARATEDVDERAALALALGELGAAPRELLTDPWLVVRGCAALAPALAEDPVALDILAELITCPRAFDAGFTRKPQQFPMWPRYRLIQAACERIADPSRLIEGIGAIVPGKNWFVSGFDIEPYLRRFFADGWPSLEQRSSGQRPLARLIAHSDSLWNPKDGNRSATLTRMHLPNDRDAWTHLADTPAQPGVYSAEDIQIVTAAMAVRRRPAIYFGRPGTDPGLADAIVDQVARAYRDAAADGTVQDFQITVTSQLGFVLEVTGHTLPLEPGPLDAPAFMTRVMTAPFSAPGPLQQVSLAALMSIRATATIHTAGQSHTQSFADAFALGPVLPAPATTKAEGYRLTFELDSAHLTPDARLTELPTEGFSL